MFTGLRRSAAAVVGGAMLVAAPLNFAIDTVPAVAQTSSGTAGAGPGIDTSDRAEVADAWRSRMAPNLDVPSGWTGSVRGCVAGDPSAEAQRATLESINFVRAMAGLDPVAFSGALSNQAQQAALIMTANHALSHDPPRSWDCWTRTGSDAAGRSNIGLTSGQMTAGRSIELYMDDAGSMNHAVGHRRWVLNPFAATMGNGLTSDANALYVMGATNTRNANPAWVSWPTAGWFPTQLQPAGRWSLSSGRARADFGRATVTVKHDGVTLPVKRFSPHDGYGRPTLVFQVRGLRETGAYRVIVRNIRGAATSRHEWTVRLFRP